MSRKPKRQRERKPRRPLFGEDSWFERLLGSIRFRVGNMAGVKALAEHDGEPHEPIDFSSPSIPYYLNLAEKFHLARIVLYMVLFAFLVVTLFSTRQLITYENLYYLVKDIDAAGITARSSADHLSYPMSQATPDFAPFRGGIVVAGGDEITVLSGSGKQTLSDNVSLSTPCVSAGGQYFITYSRGAKDFTVYNAFVRVHKELTDYPIYDACMGNDGSFGVLTRSMDYTSEVIWYSDKMNKLAACHIGGYVTALSMSSDSRTLAVLSMDMVGGAYESKLTLLRRDGGGNVTYEEVTRSGASMGATFLTDERLCVIYDGGFCIYRLDGQVYSEQNFDSQTPILWGSTTGYFGVLCQDDDRLSAMVLSVFDQNGRSVYETDITGVASPTSLVMVGQNVYLQDATHILCVSGGGKHFSETQTPRNALGLLVSAEGELLMLTPSYAQYLDTDDFETIS